MPATRSARLTLVDPDRSAPAGQGLDPTAGPALSRDAALDALARLLDPALALALQAGLKYADIDALVREALLRLAPGLLAAAANTSQISVLTGLHRKEVARWRSAEAGAGAARRSALRSHASLVFSHWRHLIETESCARRLPLAPDFTALARAVVKDVHPRSVLDELVRLGLAAEQGGEVELLQDVFVPKGAADDRLALMAANAADHLATGVANCAGQAGEPAWLEQAIWAEGAQPQDCLALDERARALWAESQRQLFTAITALQEAPAGTPRYRVRIGMYVHAEPEAAPPPPTQPRNGS